MTSTPAGPLIAPEATQVSILPCPPSDPVQHSAETTYLSPLLDLLRTAAAEHGEVTFRVLPSDDEWAAVGVVDRDVPVIHLPAPDRDTTRPERMLVSALHQLAVADLDPSLDQAAEAFVMDATARTLTAMARGGYR